jgi:hypothetical protein
MLDLDFSRLSSTKPQPQAVAQPAANAFESQPSDDTPDLQLSAFIHEAFFIGACMFQRQMMGAIASLTAVQRAGLMLVEITNGPLSYANRVGMLPNIQSLAQTTVAIGRSKIDPAKKALIKVPVQQVASFQAAENGDQLRSDQEALIAASRRRHDPPTGGEIGLEPISAPHMLLYPELGPHWWHTPNDWYTMFVAPLINPRMNQYLALAYPTQMVSSPPLGPGVYRVTSEMKSFYHAGYAIKTVPESFVLDAEAITSAADTTEYLARYNGSNTVLNFHTRLSRVLIGRLLISQGWVLTEKTPQLEIWQLQSKPDTYMAAPKAGASIGELSQLDEGEVSNA